MITWTFELLCFCCVGMNLLYTGLQQEMQVVVFLNIFLWGLHFTGRCAAMFQQSKHRLQRRTVQFLAANIEEVEARGIQLVADLQPHS